MTADLSALIARLEAAEVGSRELDAHLWDLEDDRPRHDLDGDGAIYKQDPMDTVAFDSPPPFTTSLDAALALAERVLPGWTVDCHTADGSHETYPIRKDMVIFDDGDCEFTLSYCHPKIEPREIGVGYSRTPALALCIAILRAKQGGV